MQFSSLPPAENLTFGFGWDVNHLNCVRKIILSARCNSFSPAVDIPSILPKMVFKTYFKFKTGCSNAIYYNLQLKSVPKYSDVSIIIKPPDNYSIYSVKNSHNITCFSRILPTAGVFKCIKAIKGFACMSTL